MKHTLKLLPILLLMMTASICYAQADILEIKVIEYQFIESGKVYIAFEAIDSRENGKSVNKRLRKYSVHVEYNPRYLALPVERQEHEAAIKLLKTLLLKDTKIKIWRMSGQGYRPINNRKGHYRTDALKIVSYSNTPPSIILVHSDNSFFATR